MNSHSPPDGDFVKTLEPILLTLGGAMTLGLCIFVGWLIRTMVREDRKAKADGDLPHTEGQDEGGA